MKLEGTILIPLADGFEEIEAVTIIDVLRRAELDVTSAGLKALSVRGAHGISVQADVLLADVPSGGVGMLVLPGGMPGTKFLAQDARIKGLIQELHAQGRPLGAICAAPMVLAQAGVLEGRSATSHPSVRNQLGPARVVAEMRVVRSEGVLTSQGPGTSLEFALAIVRDVRGDACADELADAMLVRA